MSQIGFVRRRGDTWTAYWIVETQHGDKQRTKGGFRTRKDAQGYLTEALSALGAGVFAEPTAVVAVTRDDAAPVDDRQLPGQHQTPRPAGNRRQPIQLVGVDHLDRLYAQLLKSGLSPKTVRNVHVMLHRALKDAVRKNLIARNPAEVADERDIDLSGGSTRDADLDTSATPNVLPRPVVPQGARRVCAGGDDRDAPRRGARPAMAGRRLRRAGAADQPNDPVSELRELILGGPKTARSRRRVTLDPETLDILRHHRIKQRDEKAMVGKRYDKHGLVFSREDGGPLHPDYFSQTFNRTVARLGLPKIQLHDLRHTHATLGLAAGVPVKVISERLGHATSAFTQDVYMHVIPDLEHDAADQIAGLVFGSANSDQVVNGRD